MHCISVNFVFWDEPCWIMRSEIFSVFIMLIVATLIIALRQCTAPLLQKEKLRRCRDLLILPCADSGHVRYTVGADTPSLPSTPRLDGRGRQLSLLPAW